MYTLKSPYRKIYICTIVSPAYVYVLTMKIKQEILFLEG